jgi:hypothetical protein
MSTSLWYLIGAAQAKKSHQNVTGLATGKGFFLNFVMQPHWTSGISQIWLQVKEESRKF